MTGWLSERKVRPSQGLTEALACQECDGSEFILIPDGRIICGNGDCYAVAGRWANVLEHPEEPVWRVSWEMVRPSQIPQFLGIDDVQATPNSKIPDSYWKPESRMDLNWRSASDQYRTLHGWAVTDAEFVRKVRIEKLTAGVWEEVDGNGRAPGPAG
jgi:hypothetical protein